MPQADVKSSDTLRNLLTAFEGESNAHAKYIAFASKADGEGFHGAASLFRAAARAEQIHAANHAKVIAQMGGVAKCDIHPVDVGSTVENLKTALHGEQYEIDEMYPGFIAEAAEHKNAAAGRTFRYAFEAEKTHARLYGEAVDLLQSGKTDSWIARKREFHVCSVCGYTSEEPREHDRCPVCGFAWDKFEVVS